jgi:hypothetical protein
MIKIINKIYIFHDQNLFNCSKSILYIFFIEEKTWNVGDIIFSVSTSQIEFSVVTSGLQVFGDVYINSVQDSSEL